MREKTLGNLAVIETAKNENKQQLTEVLMKTTTLLPSIRSRMGDLNYYVTTLSFREVAKLIKTPDDIDSVQRKEIEAGARFISSHNILTNPQRFLSSIIVGVYVGSPNWTPLCVNIPDHEGITGNQKERIEGCLGLLHFYGDEVLFTITTDGKHRVDGIKLAMENESESEGFFEDNCISVIFVAHECEKDKKRTRP